MDSVDHTQESVFVVHLENKSYIMESIYHLYGKQIIHMENISYNWKMLVIHLECVYIVHMDNVHHRRGKNRLFTWKVFILFTGKRDRIRGNGVHHKHRKEIIHMELYTSCTRKSQIIDMESVYCTHGKHRKDVYHTPGKHRPYMTYGKCFVYMENRSCTWKVHISWTWKSWLIDMQVYIISNTWNM